jgi:hypothetical protein
MKEELDEEDHLLLDGPIPEVQALIENIGG